MPKKLARAGLKPHKLDVRENRIILLLPTNYKCRIPQNGGMSEQWSSLEGLSGKGEEGVGGAQRSRTGKKSTCLGRIWHVRRQGARPSTDFVTKNFLTFLLKCINSVN